MSYGHMHMVSHGRIVTRAQDCRGQPETVRDDTRCAHRVLISQPADAPRILISRLGFDIEALL